MPRYPHYLRPAVGGRWPQRVLAVECESVANDADAERRSQTERLVRWRCTTLVQSGTDYSIYSHSTGGTQSGYWKWLTDQLATTQSTWILSERCGRVWPLIGLWEEIEHGRVQIVGTDERTLLDMSAATADIRSSQRDPLAPLSSGARQRHRDRAQGMLVVADPPCILTARVRRRPCRITWIDARNYGVSLPDTVERGRDSVAWLVQFWRDYHTLCSRANLGSAQTTTGSQSLHGWRVGYYHGGVYAGGPPEAIELEESALVGGRSEAFQLGHITGPVYHLDLRSAYASQCVRESVPIRLKRVHHYPSLSDVRALTEAHACIASVRIRTDERAYPCRRLSCARDSSESPSSRSGLVHRGDDTDIIYPIGEYTTTLCGPELCDALELGRVLRCYTLACYDSAPILRDYAQRIYDMRCEYERNSKPDMSAVCKRLLVAIVGKFGQRDRRWTHCPGMWTDIRYGEWWGSDPVGIPCRYRSLGGVVQRDDILGLSSEAVPAISAWILSAARMELLQLIRIAGWEHTYYCDTDSIMASYDGTIRLHHDGQIRDLEMGRLYIHDTWQSLEIRGVKYYVGDGRVVCSGLPRGHCVDAGDGVHYWYHSHAGSDVSRGERPSAGRVLRRYQRTTEYTHGVVRYDGRVDPIVMG